jgi:hypothetical protein
MIESVDERGSGVRVVFYKPDWAADRYGHVIAVVENSGQAQEKVVPQLYSGETSRDGWPVSPPLQNLAIELRPEGAVALLVGMSGQSHWSASFEAIPGNRRLIVDIACRLGSGVTDWRLGSMYLTNAACRVRSDLVEIDVESGSNRHLIVRFGAETELKMSSGGFSLQAKETSQRPVRWKYEVELVDVRTMP